MADGFLGRWSRRKLDLKDGQPTAAEPLAPFAPHQQPPTVDKFRATQPAAATGSQAVAGTGEGSVRECAPAPAEGGAETARRPTLEDVKALRPESDFSAFTGRNIDPSVSNAAMKKLFADPHYNIMDRMDVYIDDYSKPDPIPLAMLRQLASARFLGLFDAEEKEEAAQRARDVADNPTARTVAQSDPPSPTDPAPPVPPDHADPDLRLQQDDAAPGKNPGRGAE